MKEYNLVPQEQWNYCVCSVIQAIFDSHDIKISQDEIASKLTLSEKQGFYVDDDNFKNFLSNAGFEYKYYWRNQVLFNEIEFALDEMKGFDSFLTMNHHAYLFTEYSGSEVSFIDPKNGQLKKYSDSDLDREMRSSEITGFFGLLRKL